MKPKARTKALAELDGYTVKSPSGFPEHIALDWAHAIKGDIDVSLNQMGYLTSRDVIVPVRLKVCNTPDLKVQWLNHARTILSRRVGKLVSDFDLTSINPDEDCEALLRATNRWKE
jgi:hypothetical protein